MARRAAMAGAALAVTLAACGGDSGDGDDAEARAGSEEEQAGGQGGGGGDFCDALRDLVLNGTQISSSLFGSGDTAALEEALAAFPALAEAAQASAPPEVAEDLATVSGGIGSMVQALDGVDLSDPAAVGTALQSTATGPEREAATERLGEHARTECGFDPDAVEASGGAGDEAAIGEAPEPPDPCTFVDPQVVAQAAGVALDVGHRDGGGDVNLGSFATRSCSYANGQMVVSTMTFAADVEQVRAEFVDNAESHGGTVLADVDLRSLPPSTLVTDVSGLLSVNVLEAPTPFGIGFSALDDPAAAIAAAEAALAAG